MNPNDVTSLKIMGSAFFLLDDHTRAVSFGAGSWKSTRRQGNTRIHETTAAGVI